MVEALNFIDTVKGERLMNRLCYDNENVDVKRKQANHKMSVVKV